MKIPAIHLTPCLAVLVLAPLLHADVTLIEQDDLKISAYGDLRLRFEADFDSETATGTPRDDRARFRLRARLGFRAQPLDGLLFNIRFRTGDSNSQQSPHITLVQDEGDEGEQSDINVDRLFLTWKATDRSSLTFGRDGLAIWKPNELLWDNDVYVDGISYAYTRQDGDNNFGFNAAVALLPDGNASHSPDQRSLLGTGQFVYARNIHADKLTMAQALLFIHDRNSVANAVNDDLAPLISYTNLQYVFGSEATLPLSLGADLMYNFQDGPRGDHPHERFGFDLYAHLGRMKEKGDWLIGYTFARIEKWAVPRFLAQDDFSRFGSATQTRSSDFYGHELRAGYMIADHVNLLARYFLVDTITNQEDGQRFRLDLNIRF